MKTRLQSKKKIFIVLIVLVPVVAVFAYLYDRGVFVSSADINELWPENGPVIAIIDGREYRYDPVYLYRLTGCVFAEDPKASTGGTAPTDRIAGVPADKVICWDVFRTHSDSALENPVVTGGVTMAENAVLMELWYREQINKPVNRHVKPDLIKDARQGTMNDVSTYFHEKYNGLSEEEAKKQALSEIGTGNDWGYMGSDSTLTYYLLMEKAKFKEGQSTNSYLRQIMPYIKKHSLIASFFLPDHSLDYSAPPEPRTNESLMEKYNVEMIK